MNSWAIYERLIRNARRRSLLQHCYIEIHHIIPRSLGGSDHPENLVELTYREHFLAHWLLTKMFDKELAGRKMAFAFYSMAMTSTWNKRRLLSWQYNVIKRHLRDRGLETRARRQEFKRQLKREKMTRAAASVFADAELVIGKYDGAKTRKHDLEELATLLLKHGGKQTRVVRGRRYQNRISEALSDRILRRAVSNGRSCSIDRS